MSTINLSISKIKKNFNLKNITYIYSISIILLSLLIELVLDAYQATKFSTEVNKILFWNEYFLLIGVLFYFLSGGIFKNYLPIVYFLCFFIFLMGQKFFVVLQNGAFNKFLTFRQITLNNSDYFLFTNLIYFSIFFVFIGNIVYSYFKNYFDDKKYKNSLNIINLEFNKTLEEDRRNTLLKFIRPVFVVAFICALISELYIVKAKIHLSYTDRYLINVDIPAIFKIGSFLFTGFFFIYVMLKPKKLEFFLVLASYILVRGLIQIVLGRRALFIATLLTEIFIVIIYFGLYKKRLSIKQLLIILASVLILLFLLSLVEHVRSKESFKKYNPFNLIIKFFVSTGGSDSVIANTIALKDQFPESPIKYLFAPIYDFSTNNIIVRYINKIIYGTSLTTPAQGADFLKISNNFSAWISYLVRPEYYLEGRGMGTSYIAEIWFSLGFFMMIVFNLFLGVLISIFSKIKLNIKNLYFGAFLLLLCSKIFTLPRSGVFEAFDIFIYFFATVLLCLFYEKVYNIIIKRKKI